VVDEKDEEHKGKGLHHLLGAVFSVHKKGYGSE